MDQPPSLKLDASATGQRMRYDATLGVHMQVQLHSASATVECQMPGGAGEVPVQACLRPVTAGTGRLEQVQAVRTSSCRKAGRDARWIWPTGAYGPCSCPAQRGRRAATATRAVTAWKWPACLRGGWRYVTQSVPATRFWSSPGPSGRHSSAPSERRPPADRHPAPAPQASPLTWPGVGADALDLGGATHDPHLKGFRSPPGRVRAPA